MITNRGELLMHVGEMAHRGMASSSWQDFIQKLDATIADAVEKERKGFDDKKLNYIDQICEQQTIITKLDQKLEIAMKALEKIMEAGDFGYNGVAATALNRIEEIT